MLAARSSRTRGSEATNGCHRQRMSWGTSTSLKRCRDCRQQRPTASAQLPFESIALHATQAVASMPAGQKGIGFKTSDAPFSVSKETSTSRRSDERYRARVAVGPDTTTASSSYNRPLTHSEKRYPIACLFRGGCCPRYCSRRPGPPQMPCTYEAAPGRRLGSRGSDPRGGEATHPE